MTNVLNGIVIGLVQGGTYGLIALGLVLVFKGSRVLNFAQAEMGTASLYITVTLTEHGVPYWAGALAALAAAILGGLLFERLVVRRMTDAPRLTVAVGTIGLFSLLLYAEFYFFGPSAHYLAAPISGMGLHIAGVYVSPTQMLSFGIIAVVALGLAAFLRYTDFGLGVLAAAQDPTALRLVGVPLSRVSMFTWGMAGGLGALAALLIEPTITNLTPGAIGEPLFIGGLAAALLGGLTSLPGAFLGGIVVGIVSNEIQLNTNTGLSGLNALILFAIVMLVLLLRPQGILGRIGARAEST